MLNQIKAKFSKKQALINQMSEKQPLPMGVTEFHAWADRIIDGAMVSADRESQKFVLADTILHLNSVEDHKEDAYFIKYLRKIAANQVAEHMRSSIRDAKKAALALEEQKKKEAEEAANAALHTSYVSESDVTENVLEKPSV